MNILISKEASAFEAAAAVRKRVFIQEQGFRNEFDSIDKRAYHAAVFDNSLPIASGRLYEENGVNYVGRIAVIKEYRSLGIGLYIMKEIEKFAAGINVRELALSAQVSAKSFYEEFGYVAEGEIYYDEFCPHILMRKVIGSDE